MGAETGASARGGPSPLRVEPTAIPDVLLLTPRRHGDERGALVEVYRRDRFAAAGLDAEFVQENHAWSAARGTVRGLHFQAPPHAQAKLVRVSHGAVLDVAVDVRRGSPTFGRHVAVELSAANGLQLFIPEGFAHGYCSLTPDATVEYKLTAYYAPDSEHGVLWSDPDLGIDWPVDPHDAVLSEKDRGLARLAELPPLFRYGAADAAATERRP